jgi:hypothetical protein
LLSSPHLASFFDLALAVLFFELGIVVELVTFVVRGDLAIESIEAVRLIRVVSDLIEFALLKIKILIVDSRVSIIYLVIRIIFKLDSIFSPLTFVIFTVLFII